MKRIYTTLFALFTLVLAANAQQTKTGKIHIGFVYPLSSNGTHAPLDTNCFSLHLLAGVSAVERGLTFSGFSNIILKEADGIRVAGFSNHVGKKANGLQVAGFVNTYRGGTGASFAGFSNVSTGNINGVQLAGFANISRKVNGAQFAGFINLAQGDVSASQFAGFINIAKKVKGVQVAGFVNVADSSDYPIGFLNLVRKGEKSIGITTDETLTTILSFRSGGKYLYGILGVGYNFKNKDEVYAFEAGLGAHLFQSRIFRLNTELTSTMVDNFKKGDYFKTSIKVLPALKISSNIEIFGGPSFNYLNTNTSEGRKLHTHFIHSWETRQGTNLQALYIGYGGGIHFIF